MYTFFFSFIICVMYVNEVEIIVETGNCICLKYPGMNRSNFAELSSSGRQCYSMPGLHYQGVADKYLNHLSWRRGDFSNTSSALFDPRNSKRCLSPVDHIVRQHSKGSYDDPSTHETPNRDGVGGSAQQYIRN